MSTKTPKIQQVEKTTTQMRTISGLVTSDKMNKTVVVSMTTFVSHPLYSKRIRKTSKLHAHNELGAKTGDMVKVAETKPYSKTKTWNVVEIIKREGGK